MIIKDAETLARQLMDDYGLTDWKFKINTNKRRLGVCKYYSKQIELSMFHIIKRDIPDVRNTILHEIAHALCPNEGHSSVWRAKAISIGCNGERCGEDMEVERPHTGTCPNCGKGIKKFRRRDIACKQCCIKFNGGKFDARFRFVWS